jgi:hypothetical protein
MRWEWKNVSEPCTVCAAGRLQLPAGPTDLLHEAGKMQPAKAPGSSRDRTRLARAREHGYLDARRADAHRLLRLYALWCWRLKIPVVWLERRTHYSKYARVYLDMFTTADMLTARGQFDLAGLGESPPIVSAHDASWDRILPQDATVLAHAVLRATFRPGNREPNRVKRPPKRFPVMEREVLSRVSAAS